MLALTGRSGTTGHEVGDLAMNIVLFALLELQEFLQVGALLFTVVLIAAGAVSPGADRREV